jgi:TPR repeat protein
MKCIFCKMCEATKAALNKQQQAWLIAQTNRETILEREADQERLRRAYGLLQTDPVQGFKEYLALAEQGSIWSMGSLGVAFQTGVGTPVDLAQAEKWYRRAHESGADEGLLWLGRLYLVSQRYTEAEQVFMAGVERGFVPAMYRLAWTYAKSTRWSEKRGEALHLLERASAAGDISARRFLANAMARGWFGLRRIPSGIRLLSSVAHDLAALIEDEEPVAPKRDAQLGFLSRLVRLCPLGAVRIPAS